MIAAQDLRFEGHVQTGDELVATVIARKKFAQGRLVEFDCSLRSDGHELITGAITVRAPEQRLRYAEVAEPEVILRRTDKYARLMKKCEPLPAVTCAIAHPCDRDSLLGPIEAAKLGLIPRNFNPVIAMAGDKVIVCAEHIVPVGVIAPDHVATPAPIVDYLVTNACPATTRTNASTH